MSRQFPARLHRLLAALVFLAGVILLAIGLRSAAVAAWQQLTFEPIEGRVIAVDAHRALVGYTDLDGQTRQLAAWPGVKQQARHAGEPITVLVEPLDARAAAQRLGAAPRAVVREDCELLGYDLMFGLILLAGGLALWWPARRAAADTAPEPADATPGEIGHSRG